jgi:DNA ligase 1
MKITDILNKIKEHAGSNAKKEILFSHKDNDLLKKVLLYGLDPFTPFNIVKIPKVKMRLEFPLSESVAWSEFFKVSDRCAQRVVTGNAAINEMYTCFSSVSEDEEMWMRKILKKHLAIGASIKTVNKVFNELIPTFEVSLAQKFAEKRIIDRKICIEPKLDGIRCFGIVENGQALLYARSGKLISNFDDSIGVELSKLGEGCYDGELMGEDFTSLMRQAYRKQSVDTSATYIVLFDYLPIEEWKTRNPLMTCDARYEALLDKLELNDVNLNLLQPVERHHIPSKYEIVKEWHDTYVSEGYEGVMIKDLYAPYKFGRGWEVMKFKAFHDVDLQIKGFVEGTGKHSGKLGSFILEYNGVDVQVGSGLTDELREVIWKTPSKFIGRIIEIRYQEETPDGSLRFPTFVCFRNDK